LFGAVWSLALIGISQEIWLAKGKRLLSLTIYVVMGWSPVAAVVPLLASLKAEGFAWLAAGGLTYTAGIGFYALDHKVRHGHGIWHLFVLGGSAIHYFTILFYVA
jgi:hemolysin III